MQGSAFLHFGASPSGALLRLCVDKTGLFQLSADLREIPFGCRQVKRSADAPQLTDFGFYLLCQLRESLGSALLLHISVKIVLRVLLRRSGRIQRNLYGLSGVVILELRAFRAFRNIVSVGV